MVWMLYSAYTWSLNLRPVLHSLVHFCWEYIRDISEAVDYTILVFLSDAWRCVKKTCTIVNRTSRSKTTQLHRLILILMHSLRILAGNSIITSETTICCALTDYLSIDENAAERTHEQTTQSRQLRKGVERYAIMNEQLCRRSCAELMTITMRKRPRVFLDAYWDANLDVGGY